MNNNLTHHSEDASLKKTEHKNIAYLNEDLYEAWQKADNQSDRFSEQKEEVWESVLMFHKTKRKKAIVGVGSFLFILAVGISLFFPRTKAVFTPQIEQLSYTNNSLRNKELLLSDGSLVQVEPISTISYPKAFAKDQRKISLKGNATFNVEASETKPFTVIVNNLAVTALGTQFTIKTLSDSKIEIQLIEGKLNLNPINTSKTSYPLKAGEVVIFDPVENRFVLKNSTHQKLRQPDHIIMFKKASVTEVASTLSKRYNVQIKVPEEGLIKEKLVYRIDTRKMDIEDVIEGINLVSNYQIIKMSKHHYLIKQKNHSE